MDGYGHEHVATDRGAAPARGHKSGEWLNQPPLPVVLQGVHAGACRTVEIAAPLELDDAGRRVRGESYGHAHRLVQPALQLLPAALADHVALLPAAGARRR